MAMTSAKNIKSKYKHVRGIEVSGNTYWTVKMKGISESGFKTEYEAAKAVDVLLIKQGKEPINVLKRAK
jgi:hypothetical protein